MMNNVAFMKPTSVSSLRPFKSLCLELLVIPKVLHCTREAYTVKNELL